MYAGKRWRRNVSSVINFSRIMVWFSFSSLLVWHAVLVCVTMMVIFMQVLNFCANGEKFYELKLVRKVPLDTRSKSNVYMTFQRSLGHPLNFYSICFMCPDGNIFLETACFPKTLLIFIHFEQSCISKLLSKFSG